MNFSKAPHINSSLHYFRRKTLGILKFNTFHFIFRGPAQRVRLGVINLDSKENLQEILVSARIAHPEHKPPAKYNDIALLKLVYPVNFSPFVRPACLNTQAYIPQPTAIATGFGKTTYGKIFNVRVEGSYQHFILFCNIVSRITRREQGLDESTTETHTKSTM